MNENDSVESVVEHSGPSDLAGTRAELSSMIDAMDDGDGANFANDASPDAGLELAEDDPALKHAVTPAEKKPEEPATPRASRAIAEAIKREREADRVSKEAKEVIAKQKSVEETAARVKAGEAHPNELLEALGLTYGKITEAMVRQEKPKPDAGQEAKTEVEKLRAELAAERQAAAKAKEDAEIASLDRQLIDQTNKFITANADSYDAIRAYGEEQTVLAVQMAHHEKTGELLTLKDAADKVEQWLVDTRVNKAFSTKYAKSQGSALSVQSGKPPQGVGGNQGSKTAISNAMTGTFGTAPKREHTLADAKREILEMLDRD